MLTALRDGMLGYGRGYALLSRHRLWHFALVPAAIGSVVGGAIGYATWRWYDDVGAWMAGMWPFAWGAAVAAAVANALSVVAVLALGLVLFKQVVMTLASPFMSLLSEALERRLTNPHAATRFNAASLLRDLARGGAIATRNLARELILVCLLLVAGLVPFLTPLAPLAIFAVQAYYAGFANMDYTLERHLGIGATVRFVRAHRAYAIGNGAVFLLLLMTGIGFLIALPLAAAAATPDVLARLDASSPTASAARSRAPHPHRDETL